MMFRGEIPLTLGTLPFEWSLPGKAERRLRGPVELVLEKERNDNNADGRPQAGRLVGVHDRESRSLRCCLRSDRAGEFPLKKGDVVVMSGEGVNVAASAHELHGGVLRHAISEMGPPVPRRRLERPVGEHAAADGSRGFLLEADGGGDGTGDVQHHERHGRVHPVSRGRGHASDILHLQPVQRRLRQQDDGSQQRRRRPCGDGGRWNREEGKRAVRGPVPRAVRHLEEQFQFASPHSVGGFEFAWKLPGPVGELTKAYACLTGLGGLCAFRAPSLTRPRAKSSATTAPFRT